MHTVLQKVENMKHNCLHNEISSRKTDSPSPTTAPFFDIFPASMSGNSELLLLKI